MRTDPVPWQPSLTRRGHHWRLAAMLLVSAVAAGEPLIALWDGGHTAWLAADLVLGASAFALVHLRRRWPLGIAVVIVLLGLVSASGAGPAMLAVVSVATRRRWAEVLPLGVVLVVVGSLYTHLVPAQADEPVWLTVPLAVGFTAALGGWGMYIGSRRELMWQLRDRAERAEAEQALRAERSQANERARIAREMHDVLAHRISQISMHAGALAFRDDLPAEELRRGAADIQSRANAALDDLREVLGVLRDPETGGTLDRPQPTFDDVPRLVEECRAAGMAVDLAADVAGDVPDALGRTAYRIVQEGLTNAGKHAPGAAVGVRLSGGPGRGLEVAVTNPLGFGGPAAPGAGLGLVGLTERAQLSGGTLEAGAEAGAFTLRGRLPWPA
jgi:signal transduction histidine kinase